MIEYAIMSLTDWCHWCSLRVQSRIKEAANGSGKDRVRNQFPSSISSCSLTVLSKAVVVWSVVVWPLAVRSDGKDDGERREKRRK